MAGVIPSKKAWDKVNQTVKTVLGEPSQANGPAGSQVFVRPCVVKLSAAVDDEVGRYEAKILLLPDIDADSDLAAADFGTEKGDAIAWYPPDIGQDDPSLDPDDDSQNIKNGHIIGFNSDGKAVVVISGGGVGKGTDRYQVFQMVTDSKSGWDWVRFH